MNHTKNHSQPIIFLDCDGPVAWGTWFDGRVKINNNLTIPYPWVKEDCDALTTVLQKTDANLGFSDQSNGLSRYEYGRRWTTPGQVTDVPKPVFLGTQSSSGSFESSRFLYDGSYIRLRDVTLSYNLPIQVLNKFKLSNAKIYLRGQNLFTYVKDKRFNTDPEVSIDGTMSQRPPVFNTFLFGLDINF
jgi:hypothetical protein